MEPPNPAADWTPLGIFLGVLGVVIEAMRRSGKSAKPEVPQQVQLSGALVTKAGVDPLMSELSAHRAEIAANRAATERLCDLMEKEVGLRQSSVEEARRNEERKAMALSIADQVREDILQEMRNEIHKNEPAKMPPVRKTPRQSE